MIAGDFNISLSVMDGRAGQKISKETEDTAHITNPFQ